MEAKDHSAHYPFLSEWSNHMESKVFFKHMHLDSIWDGGVGWAHDFIVFDKQS